MGKYVINGGKKLYGKVEIESAKNAVLPIIASSILTKDEVIIEKCPKIGDVFSMLDLIKYLGGDFKFEDNNLIICNRDLNKYSAPKVLTERLRSSVIAVGALLSRFKMAEFSFPGGCDIGKRPIDFHLSAFKSLGVEVEESSDGIKCFSNKIVGGNINLLYPSVGATENAILCATCAEGITLIKGCAKEPEIVDLASFINSMGGNVIGAGTNTIKVKGVKSLHGSKYKPIPDRIETGTFLTATAVCGGEIELNNIDEKNILSLVSKFCDNTCKITVKNGIINMRQVGQRKGFVLKTGPYPMFPTDMQPQMSVLALSSIGNSEIYETVFENRFRYVYELNKMGADIEVNRNRAFIKGKPLHGGFVSANDLRGGAALVLAGLYAEGKTVIDGISHIKRGYCDLDRKLSDLGADISQTD